MPEQRDKMIDKIQQIFSFIKVYFMNKLATGITRDLARLSKSRNLINKKANSEEKYFIYKRLGHCRRKCILPDYQKWKKNKNKSTTDPYNWQQRNRNQANIVMITTNNLDSNPELIKPGKTNMVKMVINT